MKNYDLTNANPDEVNDRTIHFNSCFIDDCQTLFGSNEELDVTHGLDCTVEDRMQGG